MAAYSMRKYLQAPAGSEGAIDLIGFLDYCGKLGLGGAELTSYYFPKEIDALYLNALKRHAHMAGLSISGGAIGNDYCQRPGEKLEKDLAHTEAWINHYADLGAPMIRVFAGHVPLGDSEDAVVARCAATLEKACESAGKRGVMLALENHGGITAKADTMLKIVQAVQSPWFGVNFDSGNFASGPDPYAELAKIAPYAVNAQVKVEIKQRGKKEPADIPRIIKILLDAGYGGWIVLEYEANEDPYQGIPKAVDQLRAAIA
jgi:sugar phosphate isomerase/epimerase